MDRWDIGVGHHFSPEAKTVVWTIGDTMPLKGHNWIASRSVQGSGVVMHGFDPAAGAPLDPGYAAASDADIDLACEAAWKAFDAYRETSAQDRALFLEEIALGVMALGDELIERGMLETGLPRARLEGERGRTVGQLRLFADVVRSGRHLGVRVDTALPDRQPAPRPDLRLRNIPLGPVAVFAASNFPLAFSVAGGDTASALAAGCPVVVKAHGSHPGVSELVGAAISAAVARCNLPKGVFSLVYGPGAQIGQRLVSDPRIKAVGFTGSRGGGTALVRTAQARHEPIPVYAEMSSINPVILLPGALKDRGNDIGKAFVAALTQGAGQFCTNPGLILALEGSDLGSFYQGAAEALEAAAAGVMLSPGIHKAYEAGVAKLETHDVVSTRGRGQTGSGYAARAGLFETTAADFLKHEELADEVFGPASLVVRCADLDELQALLEKLEGQLTAAIHVNAADLPSAKALIPVLERKVGRILLNGFGTGVEVAHAMVHGGPYPSTSDSRTTSVGSLAIDRFLRPVCYQGLPDELLPDALKEANAGAVPRLLNGIYSSPS
jgi:alpha-ketoglutaric semialdehyde dehydrogenase